MAEPRPFISAQRIAARNRQLGQSLTQHYAGQNLLVLPLLSGACCFVADLVRQIQLPDLELQFIAASSYVGTESSGTVRLGALPDVTDRTVLVVDDILDGRTLERTMSAIANAGAKQVASCVLLDKPARRVAHIHADWVGFTIPDRFVVGYGKLQRAVPPSTRRLYHGLIAQIRA